MGRTLRWFPWILGVALLGAVAAAALRFSKAQASVRLAERAKPRWLLLALVIQAAYWARPKGRSGAAWDGQQAGRLWSACSTQRPSCYAPAGSSNPSSPSSSSRSCSHAPALLPEPAGHGAPHLDADPHRRRVCHPLRAPSGVARLRSGAGVPPRDAGGDHRALRRRDRTHEEVVLSEIRVTSVIAVSLISLVGLVILSMNAVRIRWLPH